jgi:tetratricopeptide (TPR) repeat protein
MENNDYIERLHKYLNREMEGEERARFESELANNEQLVNDLAEEKKLLAGIRLAGDDALRKAITAADKNLESQRFFHQAKVVSIDSAKTTKSFAMRKIMSIAAAAVVLIGLVYWGFFREKATVDTEQIFAANFKPETTLVKDLLGGAGLLPADSLAQDSLKAALTLYDAGKYHEATIALDSILVHHPTNDTAQFYLGMGHLNSERYARAIEVLEPLTKNEASSFQLTATWYLGLCYFKVDDGFEKAEEIFTALANNPESKDRQSAQGILKMIGH